LYRTTYRAPGQNVTLPAQFPHEEDLEAPVELPLVEAPKLDNMTDKDFLDVSSFHCMALYHLLTYIGQLHSLIA
jgi:hypothetical protein